MADQDHNREPSVAVLGAGNGGQAMAAHLAHQGLRVRLYDWTDEVLEPLKQIRHLVLEMESSSTKVYPELITSELSEAIRGADVVAIVLPAFSHQEMVRRAAPWLEDGQILLLHPGGTGGALEAKGILESLGTKKKIVVVEAQQLVYACRRTAPNRVKVNAIKSSLPVSVLPASSSGHVKGILERIYPQVVIRDSIWETSLSNMNAMLHAVPFVANLARIEMTQGDFDFYNDGISPGVARVMEAMDEERLSIATRLGFELASLKEWISMTYHVSGDSLYDSLNRLSVERFGYSKAPADLTHRYVEEDIPYGIVPMMFIAESIGVQTPIMKSIVAIASLACGRNFSSLGRTAKKMGIGRPTDPERLRRMTD